MVGISVTQTLLFVAAILAIVMQYKYSDKRTRTFKRLRNVLIAVTVVAYPMGLWVSWLDNNEKQNQIVSVKNNFDSVKYKLDTTISNLASTRTQLKILDSRSAKLDSQLMPFLNLATKKYPKLSSDSALSKLRVTIINNTIINNGPTKRVLRSSSDSMIRLLQKQPKGAYQLNYLTNDPETYDLALEIDNILVKGGWQTIPPNLFINKPGMKGISIYVSKEEEPLITFVNELSKALGNKGVGVLVSEEKLNQISYELNGDNVIPKKLPTALVFIGTNPDH